MRSVLNLVSEVILWPFGIRRKRCTPREHEDGGEREPLPEDSEGWEVHKINLFGAITGALLAWWALGRFKALPPSAPSPAAPGSGDAPSQVASTLQRIPLSEFLRLLRAGAVGAVTYMADRPPAGSLVVKPTRSVAPVETLLFPGCHQSLFDELRAAEGVRIECADVSGDEPLMGRLSLLLDACGGIAVLVSLAYLLKSNGQGPFAGKHLEEAAPMDKDHRPNVTFEDVAGMEGTKEELREVIEFLRNPSGFYALGAHPPRGILLTGPSGTGKTLLARAVAGEAGVPFLYSSSAAFVEIYVGQGAQRVRQFFEQARGCAPCIVFLDELDAVGAARQMNGPGGNQEYAQTVNQLLLELDGIESHAPSGSGGGGAASSRVVVTMAATNRYDCLDEALVRPGRLDRIVLVGLPTLAERVATLRIHARRLNTDGLNFELVARRTEGYSGADLAGLLNEAALLAARRRADAVRMAHVVEVLDHPRPAQRSQATPASQGEGGWWLPEGGRGGDGSDLAGSPELWARMLASMATTMAASSQAHAPQTAATVEGLD